MSAPIMLYFSDPACGYCRKLEKEIFLPMLRSGDYEDRVLLRKISWLSRGLLNDFDGSKRELRAIAERYHVQVTPTMIFVDEEGTEIAKRILGYNGPDFFWFYLDRSIDEGQAVLLKRMQKN
ncbi:MAG: thioredoxin fold domain-containing protein [Porticoccaceae bacterium]